MSPRGVVAALGALLLLAATTTAGAADRPEGLSLRTARGFEPLAKLKVTNKVEGGIKRFLVPLEVMPEALLPLQVLDLLPSTFHVYLLKLREDGQIFSWNAETAYFEDGIAFGPRYDEKTPEGVLSWKAIEPGIWAFVESTFSGIGEVCYVFRVPGQSPGDALPAESPAAPQPAQPPEAPAK